MTIAQCTTLMRLFVFLALAFGFVGFLATARPAGGSVSVAHLQGGFGIPTGIAAEEGLR